MNGLLTGSALGIVLVGIIVFADVVARIIFQAICARKYSVVAAGSLKRIADFAAFNPVEEVAKEFINNWQPTFQPMGIDPAAAWLGYLAGIRDAETKRLKAALGSEDRK